MKNFLKSSFTINPLCFTEEKVKVIVNTLNNLLEKYEMIEINTIGDFYSKDLREFNDEFTKLVNDLGIKEAENFIKLNNLEVTFDSKNGEKYEDMDLVGIHFENEKSIYFNHKKVWELDTTKTDELLDRRFRRIETRKRLGEPVSNLKTLYNLTDNIVTITWHEFGHALDYQLNISKDKRIVELYNNLSKEEITLELCEYATQDIGEFIACAFAENSLNSCRPLAKKVKEIIDAIYSERCERRV